jgi:hypothetical protein
MRRMIAVGMAGLLALTITASPLSAADLGMPTKAPIITKAPAAEEFDILPAAIAVALLTVLAVCLADCHCTNTCQSCTTPAQCQ